MKVSKVESSTFKRGHGSLDKVESKIYLFLNIRFTIASRKGMRKDEPKRW